MSTPNAVERTIPLAVVGDTPASLEPGAKQVAGDKIARSPVQFADAPVLRKPSWIRVRIPSGNAVQTLKAKLVEKEMVIPDNPDVFSGNAFAQLPVPPDVTVPEPL